MTASGWINPFPIVVATLHPKAEPATKLKNAAHTTAWDGPAARE